MTDSENLSVGRSTLNVERSALSSVDADNPWPGLASFTEKQRGYFHGRDEEIIDLTQLTERRPLVVLFGQSGLGKSSILQAGVFPRLRVDGFCPIYVRLDHAEAAPPPAEQIKELVRTETSKVGTWTKPGSAKSGETLWEFFHHRDDRLLDRDGLGVVPVLVFDQFEELFTLGAAKGERRDRAVAFIRELSELVENRPPAQLVARLDQSPEEMEAFDFSRTDYRVIISLREDFLPDLENLKTIMPALMHKRMRLSRMTGKQALEAVLKPGAGLVEPEVAQAIVEFVAGARGGSTERLEEVHVEPALLSVVCRELNERRRAKGQLKITLEQVSGDRREILTDFYERSVADLPEETRRFVEDKLLTKSGFRDNLALETALEEPGITSALIDTLVARRLLHLEDRGGTPRVELTHDVLAEVIRGSRDSRQQRQALQNERQRERLTRRRMWLARTIAAGLLVSLTGVSWVAWRAIHAEREQTRLRAEAEAQELAALRKAYASDMNGVQHALATDNLGRARELLNRHVPEPGEPDLRGWEWRYLWQFSQSDAQAVVKEPGDNSVTSLSMSADRKWLALGALFGGRLTLLNLETKEQLRLPAGADNVRAAFSPTQPLLVFTTVGPGRVVFWDLTARDVIREMPLEGACNGIFFSSDGETVAISAVGRPSESRLSIWRVADATRLASWPIQGSTAAAFYSPVAATPDLRFATVATRGGACALIDLRTGEARAHFAAGGVVASAISRDLSMVATTSGQFSGASIRLWDTASGREIGKLAGHQGRIDQVAFTADGKRLLSASADQTLRLWDLASGTVLQTFRGHKTEVWRFVLLPDQRTVFSGCKDGSVYRWDLEAVRESSFSGTFDRGRGGAWSFADGGRSIVNVESEGHVTKRVGPGVKQVEQLFEIGPVTYAVFDTKRPVFAAVNPQNRLQVWDWQRRTLIWEHDGLVGKPPATLPQFSHDGRRIAVQLSPSDDVLSYREWDVASGQPTKSFDFPLQRSTRIPGSAYSPDGTKFAYFPYPSGEGQVFDLNSGRTTSIKLDVLEPGPGLQFSGDGRLLAVPSLRSEMRLFDLRANREVANLRGYMFGVHSATFSPDGKRVASGGTGFEAITLWDTESHERLAVFQSDVTSLGWVTFSPDGDTLAGQAGGRTSATRGTIYFWRAPTWAEIEAKERSNATRLAQ